MSQLLVGGEASYGRRVVLGIHSISNKFCPLRSIFGRVFEFVFFVWRLVAGRDSRMFPTNFPVKVGFGLDFIIF